MTVSFRDAVRSDTQLLLGLAGPSGSGKTLSALYIANGMRKVMGGEIFGIDTENKRMRHYADELLPYRFKHAELHPPFSPDAYLAAVEDAVAAGGRIIIIDSASHMHEGEGGVLQMHEAELDRRAGSDYAKRDALTFAAWIKPKAQVTKFVNRVLQIDAHFIFCFRAKEKTKPVANEKGKMVPTKIGWVPIITDRMDYEMTLTLLLPPDSEGVPDLDRSPKKQKSLSPLIESGKPLSEETGERLAAWAAGKAPDAPQIAQDARDASPAAGQPAPENNAPDVAALTRQMAYQAGQGTAALRDWWKSIGGVAQNALDDKRAHYKAIAEEADQQKANAA